MRGLMKSLIRRLKLAHVLVTGVAFMSGLSSFGADSSWHTSDFMRWRILSASPTSISTSGDENRIDLNGWYGNGWVISTYSSGGFYLHGRGLPSDAKVNQDAEFICEGHLVKITYTVVSGATPIHDAVIGSNCDVMIGQNDRAALEVIKDKNGRYRGFQMIDDYSGYSSYGARLKLYFRNTAEVTNCDRYWFGQWSTRKGYWDAQISKTTMGGYSQYYTYDSDGETPNKFIGCDSGLCISWDVDLPANASREYSFVVGIGQDYDPPEWVSNMSIEVEGSIVRASASATDMSGYQMTMYAKSEPNMFEGGEVALDSKTAQGSSTPVTLSGQVDVSDWSNGTYSVSFWLMNEKGSMGESKGRLIEILDGQILTEFTRIVTFDAQGGEGTMDPIVVQYGDSVTMPECRFSYTGLDFAGWATKPGGRVEYTRDVTITSLTDDTTLYAVWVSHDIASPVAKAATDVGTTSFVANWTRVSNASCYRIDVSTDANFASLVTGYAAKRVEGEQTTISGLASGCTYYYRVRAVTVAGSTSVNSNTIIVPLDATLRFNANGGSGHMDPIVRTSGSSVALPPCGFTKAGHGIAGWATYEGGEVVYAPDGEIPSLNSDMTLYAVWMPLPDFSVLEIQASPESVGPGDSLNVAYKLKNSGFADIDAVWHDGIYLQSADGAFSCRLGEVSNNVNMVVGHIVEKEVELPLPESLPISGASHVVIKVDERNSVRESDEANAFVSETTISVSTNLYLSASSDSVSENNSSGVRFTVRRSGPTVEAMTITPTVDREGQVTLPDAVTIPAGNASTIFIVKPIDNEAVDGNRTVAITVRSGNCKSATCNLTVIDNEVPKLTVTLDRSTIKEGDGKIVATVTRELVTGEPLTVYLSGVSTSRCAYPSSVVIPAGEASVIFEIEPVNNATAEIAADLTLRASSAGYTSASVTYRVEDDDVPGVTLAITPEVVSEGAGPQAIYATLTRSDQNQNDKAVRIKLTPSMANQLIMPSEITIPKYTMVVRFAIGVIDNGLDDGDREVTIDGAIVIESCGCSGQPSNGDVIQAVVGIIDNDGPSLSLTASPATMKEGLNPAGYLTLSHNSALEEDLTVRLWVDEENEDEILVPETVTIPAGQTSVRIPVQTLDDGVEDGGQVVSIYAEDETGVFAPASTWVQVSDQNLPDLTVGAVTTSQRAYVALKQFDVVFEVKNIGFASRVGGVPYQIHVVKGTSNGTTSSSTLVKSGRVDAEIAPDGVVTVPVTLSVPEMPSDYRVAVILDPADEITELDDANNTGWSSAFSVSPAYTATVSVNGTSFMPGETVTINGQATMADGVTPASNVRVEVYVLMSGTRRNKIVTTDIDGVFSLSFEPSSGEAGHYTVGACYPSVNSSSTMAAFDIMGIKRSSTGNIIWDIALGDVVTRTVTLQNRSGTPITGVRATITGAPGECELTYALPETIPGNGSVVLSMTAKAIGLTEQTDYRSLSIHIDTDQGLTLDFPAYFHSQSQKAQLRISPTSVNTTMAIGHTRYLEFTVVNDGKGDSGKVTFSIPSTSWLRLVSQSSIDNLASGESATVTLEVSPTDDDNLVLNSPLSGGRLAVNCSNGSGCSASLRFTPVSESTGGVSVDVLDNSTYVLESAPHLANANVKVTNPYTGAVVASGTTDATGRWTKTGIPEGRYQLTITADKHDSYADELVVNPGETSSVSAFIQSQVVSVSWTVEKTEIEDQYDIQLLLDFETSVPAPVVKTTLPSELPELNEGESYSFVITLENSGLIAAEEVSLTMPEIPGCEFQLSDNNIKLPAKSSRSIAAVIKRPAPLLKSLKAASLLAASSNDSQQNVCWYNVKTGVKYICGKEYPVYSYVSSLKYGKCVYASEAMAIALAETWGWGGGGSSGGWGGTPSRGNGTGGNVGTGNFTSGNGSTYQKKHCDDRVNQFANANDELSDTNQSIRDAAGDAAVDLVKSGLWALVPFSSCIDLVGNTFASKDKKGFLFTSYAARSSWWSAALAVTLDAVGCGLDVFSFGQGGKFSKLASKFGTKVWKKALKYVNKGKVPKRELLSTLKSGKELLAHSGSKALSMFKDTLTKDIFKNAADIYDNVSSAVGIGSYILGEYETGNSLWKTITGDIGGGAPKKMMLSAAQSQRPVGLIAPSYTDVQQLAIEDLTAATVGYAALSVFLDEILDKNDYIPEDTSSDVALAFVESCLESLANNGVVKSEDVPADVVDVIGTDAVMAYIESFNQGVEKWLNDSSDDGYIQTGETDVDIDLIIRAICAIGDVEQYAKRRGYEDIFDMWCGVSESISQIVDGREDEICASVTLKLSQTLAMTREAFNGTLTLYNGNGTTPIRDLKMDVSILDEEGNECRDLFVLNDLGTSGAMSSGWVVEGGLSVSAGGTGSAVIQFIPSRNAAPTVEKVYRFGGTVTYTDPFSGEKATVKLTPVALTVSPSPYLKLDYFIQRDVYADDPMTEQVEASMPAEMAVLVVNTGAGDAKNVTISSVQPEIVKNEKGLDVEFSMKDYSLDATALNGSTAHLGLNVVTLGTIPAGESQVAQWWLTSSIQGHFTKMSASVTPVNSWNTPDTVLVNPDVGMHKLIRSLAVEGEKKPYFLTSENSDLYGTPDTIYDSNGASETVRNDGTVSVAGTLIGATPTLTVTVGARGSGWNYVHAAVPGLFRYEIVSVARSDGSTVPNRNVWITDRTFRDGIDPVLEERLHLADDFASAGTCVYVVSLKAKPTDVPEVLSFVGVEDGGVEHEVRDEVLVVFTKEIDLATFTTDDIVLNNQGVRAANLGGVSISRVDGSSAKYRIYGLSSLCNTHGRYELTVQCAGIADLSGQLGAVGKSVAWTYSASDSPYIVDAEGVPVRPVRNLNSVVAVTSLAIDPASFSNARIMLNGEDVSGSLVVRSVDASDTRYEISGLEALQQADGPYTMVIEGEDLRGLDGSAGINTFTRSWTRDTVAPQLVSLDRSVGMEGQVFSVVLSENADAETISLDNVQLSVRGRRAQSPARLMKALMANGEETIELPASAKLTSLGNGAYSLTGLDAVTLADGFYTLTFDLFGITDEAGNVASGSRSVSWSVDTTPPAQPLELNVSSEYGSIDTVVQTGEGAMTIFGVTPEAGVSVQILCKYAGGTETLLASPSVADGGAFTAAVNLPKAGGSMMLIVRLTDASGNSSDTEIRVYYDKIALTAELSGAPELDTVADEVQLSFSDAVVGEDVVLSKFALTRNGESVVLDGLMLVPNDDGKTFTLQGLSSLCLVDGDYVLSFAATDVRKRSSGLKSSECAPLSWRYECPDREPPTIVTVQVDGEEARDLYTNGISSVAIEFSENVNIQELAQNGLIGQALRIELLDADLNVTGLVRAVQSDVVCDADKVAWTLPNGAVGSGYARIVVDAGLVADLAGNKLAVGEYAVVAGLQGFDFKSDIVATVDSYAMPTWYDFDGDGLGDLVVGEKTSAGEGKVRVYRNVGSATEPRFGGFTYLTVGGSDLSIAASGCQGAQVAFGDLTGDGNDDLIVGYANGKVQMWYGTATRGTYGDTEVLVTGSEPTYGSDRAFVCPYDLDGDGKLELAIGGLDGKFRMFKCVPGGEPTESWLTDAVGAPLTVAAGRSTPVLADVNNDGCVDILSGDTSGNVWAFLGNGETWNATAVPVFDNAIGGKLNRSRVGYGDVNGDGIGDLLVGRSDGSVEFAVGIETPSPSVAFHCVNVYTVTYDGLEDSDAMVVSEGSNLTIRVRGGNADLASSVQVLATYNTAAAADLDLKNATVNGAKPKSFKFPVTLEWAAGEIGEKTIEIPVAVDKSVEADEFLTLQLANPMNLEIGDVSICTVTICDPQYDELKAKVAAGTATKAEADALAKADKVFAGKAYVRGLANDATRGKVTGSALAADGKNVTLKAVANKGWVFAGWYAGGGGQGLTALPAGEPVSRTASLVVAASNDVDYIAWFIRPEEDSLSLGEDFLPSMFVVGEAVSIAVPVESVSLPTVSVSGLPAGLKYYAKETLVKATKTASAYTIPANTIYGTPTKATTKPATVTVTVKNLGGYQITRKYAVSVVADAQKPVPPATVLSDAAPFHAVAVSLSDDLAGKVTGAGVYQAGKKVTLKATSNKGYVFAGWTQSGDASAPVGEDADGTVKAATLSFTMPTEDVAYVARFVTAAEDKASIAATVADFAFGAAAESDGSTGDATNVMCGVYLQWPVAASALSETTVKVAGLPSGLKFTAKPVTTKVTSGTGKSKVSTIVTNIPPNTIYGSPTAASKTDKSGRIVPSKVKVSVTTAGKSKAEYALDLTVDPLPAWAVGEFSGLASTPEGRLGSASMSVTAAGKVSGKVVVNGTNVSFTAASYDITSKTVGETNLVAKVTGKLGKVPVTGEIAVVESGAQGAIAEATMEFYRNVWKDKGAEPVPAEAQGLYTVKLRPEEFLFLGIGTGYLSLSVDKKGAVKVAGKAADGTSLSASATLMPGADEGRYFIDLFAAPSTYKGGYVAGRLVRDAASVVSSPYGLDWTSRNPQSTGDYALGGFSRVLSASGAWYAKADSLAKYYGTLRFAAPDATERVPQASAQTHWGDLTVSVDANGKKFVVDQKATKPVQDKATKTWSYDGANDAALSLSFTQATGIWKGSFLWWFDGAKHTSTKVPFEGVMVQGEDLEGFGTYDVPASYVPYDKKGQPQKAKTYKYKESVPVSFRAE